MIRIIHLIKDRGINYQFKGKGIEVVDLYSYLESRKFYEKHKFSEEKVEIVIKKDNLFNYFLDMEEHPEVVVEEFAPKVQLGIAPEGLKRLGIEDLQDFYDVCEGDSTLYRDIMGYHFKQEKNIFKLLELLKAINYTDKKLNRVFDEKYLERYPKSMRNSFLSNPKEFGELLLEGTVFSRYSNINYRILGPWEEDEQVYRFLSKDLELRETFDEVRGLLDLRKVEEKLEKEHKKLTIFENFNMERYLNEVSGYLKFERKFYINNFFNSIEKGIGKKKEYYRAFKDKFSREEMIENLLEKGESIENLKVDIQDLEGWKKIFKEKYIYLKDDLNDSNIGNIIKRCEKEYNISLDGVKKLVGDKWSLIDEKFQSFFLENYNQLMSSETKEGLEYKLEEVKKLLSQNKKVILVFVDCLRYDMWNLYKEKFIEKEYFVQNNDLSLSMIPTVTNHCKKILFNGKKYNQIENSGGYIKGISEYLRGYKVHSMTSSSDIDEDAQLNVYEIIDIDENVHNKKGITDKYLTNVLDFEMKGLFDYLNNNEASVVICSDHGCVKILDESRYSIDFKGFLEEKSLKLENHGRYMSVSGSYFDDNIYEMLMESFNKKEQYHVIPREELHKYYLNKRNGNHEVYCYLMYKGMGASKKSSEYNHGGITLEEVMVPFAILEKSKQEYIPIEVEIIKKEVFSNKKDDIKILLKNENNLEDIEVSLKYSNESKNIGNIDGNKHIDLPVVFSQIGSIPEKILIKFKVYGKIRIEEIPLNIEVKETAGAKMNKKMKKSRSLL